MYRSYQNSQINSILKVFTRLNDRLSNTNTFIVYSGTTRNSPAHVINHIIRDDMEDLSKNYLTNCRNQV